MAQLIVRDLDERIVAALKARAARSGQLAEDEHRKILEAVLGETNEMAAFASTPPSSASASLASRQHLASMSDISRICSHVASSCASH